MPLIWNTRVSHLLGNNYAVAQRILKFQTKKLDSEKLSMIDNVFQEQLKLGIIEEVG